MARLHVGITLPASIDDTVVTHNPVRVAPTSPLSRTQLSYSSSSSTSSAILDDSSSMSTDATVSSRVEGVTMKSFLACPTDAHEGKIVAVLFRWFLRSASSYCLSLGPDILLAVPLFRRQNVDLFLTEARRVVIDAHVSERYRASATSLEDGEVLLAALAHSSGISTSDLRACVSNIRAVLTDSTSATDPSSAGFQAAVPRLLLQVPDLQPWFKAVHAGRLAEGDAPGACARSLGQSVTSSVTGSISSSGRSSNSSGGDIGSCSSSGGAHRSAREIEQICFMTALAHAAASASVVVVVDVPLLAALAQLPLCKTARAAGRHANGKAASGGDSPWDGSSACLAVDDCFPASGGMLDAAVQVALWLLHITVPEVEAAFPALRSLTTTGRLQFALQALCCTAFHLAKQDSVPLLLLLPDVDGLAATHPALLSALDDAINAVRSPADSSCRVIVVGVAASTRPSHEELASPSARHACPPSLLLLRSRLYSWASRWTPLTSLLTLTASTVPFAGHLPHLCSALLALVRVILRLFLLPMLTLVSIACPPRRKSPSLGDFFPESSLLTLTAAALPAGVASTHGSLPRTAGAKDSEPAPDMDAGHRDSSASVLVAGLEAKLRETEEVMGSEIRKAREEERQAGQQVAMEVDCRVREMEERCRAAEERAAAALRQVEEQRRMRVAGEERSRGMADASASREAAMTADAKEREMEVLAMRAEWEKEIEEARKERERARLRMEEARKVEEEAKGVAEGAAREVQVVKAELKEAEDEATKLQSEVEERRNEVRRLEERAKAQKSEVEELVVGMRRTQGMLGVRVSELECMLKAERSEREKERTESEAEVKRVKESLEAGGHRWRQREGEMERAVRQAEERAARVEEKLTIAAKDAVRKKEVWEDEKKRLEEQIRTLLHRSQKIEEALERVEKEREGEREGLGMKDGEMEKEMQELHTKLEAAVRDRDAARRRCEKLTSTLTSLCCTAAVWSADVEGASGSGGHSSGVGRRGVVSAPGRAASHIPEHHKPELAASVAASVSDALSPSVSSTSGSMSQGEEIASMPSPASTGEHPAAAQAGRLPGAAASAVSDGDSTGEAVSPLIGAALPSVFSSAAEAGHSVSEGPLSASSSAEVAAPGYEGAKKQASRLLSRMVEGEGRSGRKLNIQELSQLVSRETEKRLQQQEEKWQGKLVEVMQKHMREVNEMKADLEKAQAAQAQVWQQRLAEARAEGERDVREAVAQLRAQQHRNMVMAADLAAVGRERDQLAAVLRRRGGRQGR